MRVCACNVCTCVREREREGGWGGESAWTRTREKATERVTERATERE